MFEMKGAEFNKIRILCYLIRKMG